jgi:methionine-rich copper-binding protein CopC
MRRVCSITLVALAVAMLAVWPSSVGAQGSFELVKGQDFKKALPKDFYLEGNAIPTQERNAALVKTPAGARVLFALLDTTGYSSQIQQKYEGMLITEGNLSLCGTVVGVGSYGFGYTKLPPTSTEDGKFFLYNQAGEKVAECATKKDTEIKLPNPLQVVVEKGKPAKLYLGRYWLELM